MSFNRRLEDISARFSDRVHAPTVLRWLRHGLYTIVGYNIICLALPLHDLLWGEYSLVMPFTFPSLITNDLIMVLHDPAYARFYPVFMALPIVGILLYIVKGYKRLSALLVYIGVVVLFNRVFLYLTGGNYLLHILLFFLLFVDESPNAKGKKLVLSNTMTNFALWAFRGQLIIVYVFTLLFKLAGEGWRKGEAVYTITHVDGFTLPWFEHSVADIHWLMVLANYTALAYFFAFPFLVWSKKWKLPFLAFGLVFHLGLGIVLGVMDFSLVMMVAYIAFLDEGQIEKIKSWLPVKKRSVAHP